MADSCKLTAISYSVTKKGYPMSTQTLSHPATALYDESIPPAPVYRLTVKQYHEMIDKGILTEDDPVELLEGWLIQKMPKDPRHRLATQLTARVISRLLAAGWHVATQDPVTTSNSEPEPDVSVIRGKEEDYHARHPRPKQVSMAVEVSESTLRRDRTLKKRVYARASIPVYWIVNLVDNQIEVYTKPTGDVEEPDYLERRDYEIGQSVPLVIGGKEIAKIAVKDIIYLPKS
jgi:Uma2 family endonuclease